MFLGREVWVDSSTTMTVYLMHNLLISNQIKCLTRHLLQMTQLSEDDLSINAIKLIETTFHDMSVLPTQKNQIKRAYDQKTRMHFIDNVEMALTRMNHQT